MSYMAQSFTERHNGPRPGTGAGNARLIGATSMDELIDKNRSGKHPHAGTSGHGAGNE